MSDTLGGYFPDKSGCKISLFAEFFLAILERELLFVCLTSHRATEFKKAGNICDNERQRIGESTIFLE